MLATIAASSALLLSPMRPAAPLRAAPRMGEGDELGEEELEAERVEEQALAAGAREGEHADAEELEPKFEAPVQLYV